MRFSTAFIDFDNTLYNTHLLIQEIHRILINAGVTKDLLLRSMEEAVHGKSGDYYNFSHELHLDIVEREMELENRKKLLEELNNVTNTSFLKEDAESFLKYIKDISDKVVVLTAGAEGFQNQKIDASGIRNMVNEVIICHDKKEDVVNKEKGEGKAIFVNDNLKQNVNVKNACQEVLVVTLRDPRKYTEEEVKEIQIPYFDTLTQIQQYVSTNI